MAILTSETITVPSQMHLEDNVSQGAMTIDVQILLTSHPTKSALLQCVAPIFESRLR